MFHLVAYRSTVPAGSNFVYLTPVPDSQIRIEEKNVIIPSGLNHIIAVYAHSDFIARARVETPSLRRNMLLEIAPVARSIEPDQWEYINYYFDTPIVLDESEPMRFMAFHDQSTAQEITGLVWLADGAITPVTQEHFVARAVCQQIQGSGVWENVSITFDQVLPAGRYGVIGARLEFRNGIAYRLSFVGQSWRPGWVVDLFYQSAMDYPVRHGKLGVWGEFPHDQPPTVDILAFGSGQPILYLDLVRL